MASGVAVLRPLRHTCQQKEKYLGKYVEELFHDDRPIRDVAVGNDLTGPSITKEETEKDIQNSRNIKAVSQYEIPSELLRLLDKWGIVALHTKLNIIYMKSHNSEQWLSSTIIPTPKNTNTRKCKDYRLIGLMSHLL